MSVPFLALLLAAGRGTRMERELPKAWLEIEGRPMWFWSACKLARTPGYLGTVLALDADSLARRWPGWEGRVPGLLGAVAGGGTRQESCALAHATGCSLLETEPEVIVVHDAARPFFPREDLLRANEAAREHGAAILGHRARDTLKRLDGSGLVIETLDRSEVFHAATPQCVRRADFDRMQVRARELGLEGTDEAGLAEAAGIPVRAIEGPSTNLKLTCPEDLSLVPALVSLLEGPEGT